MTKVDQSEGAKIAVLMIIERFADANIFLETQCLQFLDQYLVEIQRGMLFKIKKFLIPAFLAVSKHISHERFLETVHGSFVKFT
jgi:hypothetical protein